MSSSSAESTSAQVDTASDAPRHESQGARGSNSAATSGSKISDLTAERNNSDTISKTVRIDQYGDLKLIVGTDKVCFLVCSRALARSAPFWKTLLYGPFAEGNPADGHDWMVELPEDHPGAIEVILNLIHWPGLPEKIACVDLDLAFEVTVLTNKYSMTHCLAPCAWEWLRRLYPVPTDDFEGYEDQWAPPLQWLYLVQELGDLTQYLTAYVKLATRCDYRAETPSATKKLMSCSPKHCKYKPISRFDSVVSTAGKAVMADLVEEINNARLGALREIKSIFYHDLEELRRAAEGYKQTHHRFDHRAAMPTTICQAKGASLEQKRDCDFSMLGLATLQQGQVGWPLTHKPEDERRSVDFFRCSTNTAMEIFNEDVGHLRGQAHKHCTPFKTGLISQKMLAQFIVDLAMGKSSYIRRQAIQSGFPRGNARSSHKRTYQQMKQ